MPCSSAAAPFTVLWGAAATDNDNLPALNPDAFRALRDMAGDGPARSFMEEYLLMLPVRTNTIVQGLGRSDLKACFGALAFLEVDSAVAGADRLVRHCGDLKRALEQSPYPDPESVKSALFEQIRLIVREAGRQGYLPGRKAPSDG